MIDDELMIKINSIEDLPISEEMLGAYLEGNLTDAEAIEVDLMIQYQPGLCELYEDVTRSLYFPYCSQEELVSEDYMNTAIIDEESHFVDYEDLGFPNMLSDFDLQALDTPMPYGDSLEDNNFGVNIDLDYDSDFNLNS